LGGPAAAVTVPAGVMGGRMLGGAAGEYAAQQLGLSPESPTQVALSGAMPGAGLVTRALPKVAARVGPLYEAGQRRAAQEVRELGGTLAKEESAPLYRAARSAIKAGPPPIATARTQGAISELADQMPKDPQNPALQKIGGILKRLEDTVQQQTPAGTMASVRDLRAELRDMKGLLKEPEARHLYGAIIDDLETAAAGGHAAAKYLRAATDAWKGEQGAARFAKLASQAITEKEGLTRVNADRLVRLVDQDAPLRRWVGDAGVTALKTEIARRGGLPKIKLGGGLPGVLTSMVMGGVGALGGGLRGPAAAAVLAGVGAIAPPLARLSGAAIREAAQIADNPQAGQIASVILQGLRVSAGRDDASEPDAINP
jgi:hypothetical protein